MDNWDIYLIVFITVALFTVLCNIPLIRRENKAFKEVESEYELFKRFLKEKENSLK